MKRTVTVMLASLLLGSVGVADGTVPPKPFVAARATAKANRGTPAGGEFDRTLSAWFGEANGPVMHGCFESTKTPDATAFELLLRLSKAGAPLEVMVWPETNIAICFRDALRTKAFPAPPTDRYWAYVEMRFAP